MNSFLALIRKDFAVFFNDPRAVVMSFLAPILIGSFFGYIFRGVSGGNEPSRVKVAFVDLEQGEVAAKLAERLRASRSIELLPIEINAAREQVRKGRIPVGVAVPAEFGQRAVKALFVGGELPKLDVFFDPSHATEAQMIKGLLTGEVMQVVSQAAFNGQLGRDNLAQARQQAQSAPLPPEQRQALQQFLDGVQKLGGMPGGGGAGLRVPFEIQEEALTSGAGIQYNSYAHAFGGMTIQFMLFNGIDVGIGMLLLRQRGLWRRFRAAPLSKLVLLSSRAVSATLIGMLILAVVFTYARLVFGVKIEGSLTGMIGVCASFALMTATYGLLIAALGKTPEAARGLSILATLMLVMLSGAWVPSFLFPQWLQAATKFLPTRWAMDGLDGMTWRGLPLSDAMLPIAVLLGSSLVFGAIAVVRFRWDAD